MSADVVDAAKSAGLQVHPDKSKIVTNAWVTTRQKILEHLRAASHKFEISEHTDSVKYLGRQVSMHDPNKTEFANRTAKAWACFSKRKDALTDWRYALNDRMKLLFGEMDLAEGTTTAPANDAENNAAFAVEVKRGRSKKIPAKQLRFSNLGPSICKERPSG